MGFQHMSGRTLHAETRPALHVAIIMDGSGRWATGRGVARSAGHRAGVEAARRTVRAAPGLGIGTLTLHAFSSDNWGRPEGEVAELLRIFRDYFRNETAAWIEDRVQVNVLGRRDRIPPNLRQAIQAAEAATRGGDSLHLRLAIDYSGRESILQAASRLPARSTASPEDFSRLLAEINQAGAPSPEVDLQIRTGGEQRLSDFMLWEIAYAELVFQKCLWPDFDAADLRAAVEEFHLRDRRFGRIPQAAAV